MKTALLITCSLAGGLAICVVGFFAARLGLVRLNNWCARQLTDSPVADN